MASLDPLRALLYHERQQPGSMLCAQHALNNLLQGNYFTPPDLAAIANNLDSLEASVDESHQGSSSNMDDTGFFSVQVLEEALKVWGLRLVRWRSEEMRDFQGKPYAQLAFILNLELHWFTLRRFGPASSSPYEDPGGHWFNLNSFLDVPEWISRTYLDMVLQQAEQEGYFVFAVCQIDPSSELTLARVDADRLAESLPQPTSAGLARLNTSRALQTNDAFPTTLPRTVAGAEDEDLMLQAALQASLMGDAAFGNEIPAWLRNQEFPAFQPRPAQNSLATGLPTHHNDDNDAMDDDPVTASIARSRALLERMRRDQDVAIRGALDDDIVQHIQRAQAGSSLPSTGREFLPDIQRRRTASEDEEDTLLRQTLVASQDHIVYDSPPRQNRFEDLPNDHEIIDSGDNITDDATENGLPTRVGLGRSEHHIVYDDDDAELQAALRASLAGLPEGFMLPPSPGPVLVPSQAILSPAVTATTPGPTDDDDEDPVPAKEPSPEELRRRRLARFS